MMKFLIFLLFVYVCKSEDPYCYSEDRHPYLRFGSKTSYDVVRGYDTEHLPPACEPVYMWGLIRHGVRYSDGINATKLYQLRDEILHNHKISKRGSLCAKDLQKLGSWTYNAVGKTQDELTPRGYMELAFFARRLKNNFKNLVYSNAQNKLEFQCTSKERTRESAKTFVNVLLEPNRVANKDHNIITVNDEVLRFLERSEDYKSLVKDNKETYREEQIFMNSKYMEGLQKNLSNRLGFKRNLSFDSIDRMYTMCSFENAWSPQSYPGFCTIFLKWQLEILEYLEDLHDFYELGYGSYFNIQVPNPIIDDLVSKMIRVSQYENLRGGSFYFTHSAIIAQTVVKFGLFRDVEPLKYDSKAKAHNIKWSMSDISPFSANLIAVAYKCKEMLEDYKIMIYHNERIVKYPECDKSGLCSLKFFLEKFGKNFYDNMMHQKNQNVGGNSSGTTVVPQDLALPYYALCFYFILSLIFSAKI